MQARKLIRAKQRRERLGEAAEKSDASALVVPADEQAERKRVDEALAASEQKFRAVFDQATIGIALGTVDGRCVRANKAACNFIGATEEEVCRLRIQDIVHPDDLELTEDVFPRLVAGEIPSYTVERRYVRRDGTIVWGRASVSLVRDGTGRPNYLVGVMADVTHEKKVEQQQAAFSQLGYRLSAAVSRDEAAHIILGVASELFGWDAGYVHLCSEGTGKVGRVVTVDTIKGRRESVPPTIQSSQVSPMMRRVMREGAQLINRGKDCASGPELVPFGDTQRRSASLMFVPVRSGGPAVGIVSIQSYTPGAYSRDDLQLLQVLADRCGDALRRIKLTEALGEAEAKYRSIFENATEGIFQTTPGGRYLSANAALAHMFGFQSPAELIAGVTDIERQAYVRPEARDELRRLLESQVGVHGFETECYRKDGSTFWMSLSGRAVRDESGAVVYYEGTTQDITARKRAEAVLRESEEKFRTLFESAPIGIALHDASGHYVHTNHAYQQMLGYTKDELHQLGTKRVTHPDDIPEGQRLFNELREAKRDHYQREKRYVRKDGRIVWAQSSASAVRNERGQLSFIISMVEDITRRKEALEALNDSERKLRLIAENTTDVIFAFDMNRQPVYGNPAVEQLTGYTFAEIQAQKFVNWIHPDDRDRMLRHWEELYAGKGFSEVEFRLITKTGKMKWCSSTWGPIRDEAGRQIGVQGREHDITERTKLTEALREAEARYRSIFENATEGIFQTTPVGRYLSANPALARMFGYETAEEIMANVTDIGGQTYVVPERREELKRLLEEQGAIQRFESERYRKDGTVFWISVDAHAVRDGSGKVLYFEGTNQDITEIVRARGALARSHEELERLVQERTAQLEAVNRSLQQEMADRQRLERQVLESVEREQQRIGQDLHDGLCQLLAGIKFKAASLRAELGHKQAPKSDEFAHIEDLANQAMRQGYGLARGLNPVKLPNRGLKFALEELAASVQAAFGVTCVCDFGRPVVIGNQTAANHLYRIAQEAIHNAVKHGKAKRIAVTLNRGTDGCVLAIRDDGVGFRPRSDRKAGMGLQNMKARAAMIGATLEIRAGAAGGTVVTCSLPIPDSRARIG